MLKIGIIPLITYKDADGTHKPKYGDALYTWQEIKKINKQKGTMKISEEFFNNVQLLALNKLLEQEIIKFREKFSILPIPEDFKYGIPYILSRNNSNEIFNYLKNEISPKFKMPFWLNQLHQLEFLFCHGVVLGVPIEEPISILPNVRTTSEYFDENFNPDSINIKISSSNITKQQLHDYIDKHWNLIKGLIKGLKADKKTSPISSRDLEIFDLKQKGKTFTKIADHIANKTNNEDLNESTIKQACYRTKKKINSVFEPIVPLKKVTHS